MKKIIIIILITFSVLYSDKAMAETWYCKLESVYYYSDREFSYELDTEFWVKNRKFTSFVIETDTGLVRHLKLASGWKSKIIKNDWSKGVLFEIYDEHGMNYIVHLFPKKNSSEKNRRYSWIDLSSWLIELGECDLYSK